MNRSAKRVLLVLFALAFTAAFARPGRAETRGKQSAEAHYQKGMKAYTLGHFPEAIEEFEKAYELRSEPIFLYNIAQSHRQNNSPQRAIFFYRRYLEADPEAKNRPEIEKRIKEMEAQLNAKPENAAAQAPTPVAPPVAPPVAQSFPVAPPAAPVGPQPVPVTQVQAQPTPAPATGRRMTHPRPSEPWNGSRSGWARGPSSPAESSTTSAPRPSQPTRPSPSFPWPAPGPAERRY